MKIVQGKTPKGSLTNCVYVIEDNGDAHCFSYGEHVAAIIDGEYIEYSGYMYFSPTSNRHKAAFRRYFGVAA